MKNFTRSKCNLAWLLQTQARRNIWGRIGHVLAINNVMKVLFGKKRNTLQTSDKKHCNLFGSFLFFYIHLIPCPIQFSNHSTGSGHTAQQQQQSGEYFPRISSGQPACPATGLPVSPALCHCTLGQCGQRSSSS